MNPVVGRFLFGWLLQNLLEALESPVDLFALDDQWWRDASDPGVSFLAEYAFFLEGFAVLARLVLEFDADPQAAAANFPNERAAQRLQFAKKVSA